jgi:hypothetical protein
MRSNIKKIDNAFREFVEKHLLINSYKSFDYDGVSDNNVYPLLWADMNHRRVPVREGSLNPTIPIFIFCGPEIGDSATMQAEAEQLAYDFLTHFAENEDVYNFDCSITTELTPVMDTIDKSEGVMFDIEIMFRAAQNQCEIPFE